jgi:hypothetical protein
MKAILKQREREIQKRRKHTCLSISVKLIMFFFSFLGGFSATEVFVLLEPCQIKKKKKLLSVGFDAEIKAEVETIS